MRIQYYPETDSLYIELSERPSTDSREIADGLVVDLDEEGNVVGLDFEDASKKIGVTNLEAIDLPLHTVKVA